MRITPPSSRWCRLSVVPVGQVCGSAEPTRAAARHTHPPGYSESLLSLAPSVIANLKYSSLAMVTSPGMTNVSTKLKTAIKRVPGTQSLYFKLSGLRLPRSVEDVFRTAITENKWGFNDSVSGGGSDLRQTQAIRERLPTLWSDFDIGAILDLPCGDFYWMQQVPMDDIRYIGADILSELVEQNNQLYGRPNVAFRKLNLLEDALPKVDLILCRDCLVHFSYRHIEAALRNICDSGSIYLLTTTFPARRKNHDIATGQFRPINLQARPLSLPVPILMINEGCTERDGSYQDKSLGLWRVSDVRARLEGHHPR